MASSLPVGAVTTGAGKFDGWIGNSTDMSLDRRNSFFKGHALGNDYVVVDPQNLDFQAQPRYRPPDL